jgi:hypothetical protein
MLYTLVMLVCLADSPCERREQIVGDLAMHPGVAFAQAQPLVAQWAEANPGYVVKRWRLYPGSATGGPLAKNA